MKSAILLLILATAFAAKEDPRSCHNDCCSMKRQGKCPKRPELITKFSSASQSQSQSLQYLKQCADDFDCSCGKKCCKLGDVTRCFPACSETCWPGEECVLEINAASDDKRARCGPIKNNTGSQHGPEPFQERSASG